MIIFDATGKVIVTPMTITRSGILGTRLGLTANQPTSKVNVNTQIGVALYDLSGLQDQPFYANGADLEIGVPGRITTTANKTLEDNWVSTNAQIYFVNRFAGALEKAE